MASEWRRWHRLIVLAIRHAPHCYCYCATVLRHRNNTFLPSWLPSIMGREDELHLYTISCRMQGHSKRKFLPRLLCSETTITVSASVLSRGILEDIIHVPFEYLTKPLAKRAKQVAGEWTYYTTTAYTMYLTFSLKYAILRAVFEFGLRY